jgi:hypothetical protein
MALGRRKTTAGLVACVLVLMVAQMLLLLMATPTAAVLYRSSLKWTGLKLVIQNHL